MNTRRQSKQSLEFKSRTNCLWRWSLVRPIMRWIAWRREQRRIIRDINDLLERNDHLLVDIGLSREEIATSRTDPRREGNCNEQCGRGVRCCKASSILCDFAAIRSQWITDAR
jgi:uncharacterized protein YjiS (DUF1127 family)